MKYTRLSRFLMSDLKFCFDSILAGEVGIDEQVKTLQLLETALNNCRWNKYMSFLIPDLEKSRSWSGLVASTI